MANINLTVSPDHGGAMSYWTGHKDAEGIVRYTNPTTDGFYATISKPAALTGAVIQSLTISITGSGDSGTKYVRYSGTAITVTDSNLLEKLQNGEDNIEIYFSFRATGGSGGVGQHSASYSWSAVSVAVTYTPAGAVSGTITAGTSSSIFYSIDKRSLCSPETAAVALTITPDETVTGATVEIRYTGASTSDSFNTSVDIASGATGYATFTVSQTNAIPPAGGNRVIAAQIRITLTTTNGTEQSAWTTTTLLLARSRTAPSVSATFSDTTSAYSTFGVYVQGVSSFAAAISSTLDTTADPDIYITSRTVTVGSNQYAAGGNTVSIGTLNVSGSVAYTVSVTDCYGQTGTASGTLSITAYAPPTFTALSMQRYSTDTQQLDDGSDAIWLNATGSVSALNGHNAWSMDVEYTNGTITNTANITSDTDGRAISYTQDKTAFQTRLSDQYEWTVTVTLEDQITSNVYTLTIPKSGGIFNIEKNGVAFGQRSTATSSAQKFEVAYPAYFYNVIYDQNGKALDGSDTGWQSITLDSTCTQDTAFATVAYRVKQGIVYVRGAVRLASSMTSSQTVSRTLFTLPVGARPAANMLINSGTKLNYSCVEVDSDGTVKLWNRIGAAVGTNEPVSVTCSFPVD